VKWWREVVDKVFPALFLVAMNVFISLLFLATWNRNMFFFFYCHQQMDSMYRFTIDEGESFTGDLEVFMFEQIEKLNRKLAGILGYISAMKCVNR
jgi:hypothetical protein